jgi:hypothetical protein
MANEEIVSSGTLSLSANQMAALKHSIAQAQAFLARLSDSLGAQDFEAASHETKLLHQVVSSYKEQSGDPIATGTLINVLLASQDNDPVVITGSVNPNQGQGTGDGGGNGQDPSQTPSPDPSPSPAIG